MAEPRSLRDLAADLLLYAPVGLALRLSKDVPELASQGRAKLATPLGAARVVGAMAVAQGKRDVEARVRTILDDLRSPVDSDRRGTPPTASEGEPAPTASAARADSEAPAVVPDDGATPGSANLAIPRYDTLAATQVLEHLAGLRQDELAAIEAYERSHRNRKTILQRIAVLQAR